MKEKEKSPGKKELNEKDARNLSDTEFKTMVIQMLKIFRKRMDKFNKNFNKNLVRINTDIETEEYTKEN